MKKIILTLFVCILPLLGWAQIPRPDHIVVVIEENHDWSQVIGSGLAPYIDSLASDTGVNGHTAAMTRDFDTAVAMPSQPNYLQLFSGDNQGCVNDTFPIVGSPFITPNMARELLNAGFTFIAYSENRLGQGYTPRHDPSRNWEGTGTNQIPAFTHADFSVFPSSNFTALPTVSYVIPTVCNDMHSQCNPTPDKITVGDTWLHNHMDNYIQWCKIHNSMLILTFDEGGGEGPLPTLIIGEHVQGGTYPENTRNGTDHYSWLRTIEDAYGLPHAGAAFTGLPAPTPAPIAVDNIWRTSGSTPTPTPTATPTSTPTQCIVPNLIGLHRNRCQNVWNSAGFTTQVVFVGNPNHRVVSQSIPAGTIADCNTTVITVQTH